MRRFPVLLALSLAVAIAAPAAARACSCAVEESPRAQARAVLGFSDAAFIGSLVSVRKIGPKPEPGEIVAPGRAVFRYRVRASFEVDLGGFVRVRSSTSSAACGLGSQQGRRIALGLTGRPGRWTSGLCYHMEPKALRQVADGKNRSSREGCAASLRA